jgi:hypothetical protein
LKYFGNKHNLSSEPKFLPSLALMSFVRGREKREKISSSEQCATVKIAVGPTTAALYMCSLREKVGEKLL